MPGDKIIRVNNVWICNRHRTKDRPMKDSTVEVIVEQR